MQVCRPLLSIVSSCRVKINRRNRRKSRKLGGSGEAVVLTLGGVMFENLFARKKTEPLRVDVRFQGE